MKLPHLPVTRAGERGLWIYAGGDPRRHTGPALGPELPLVGDATGDPQQRVTWRSPHAGIVHHADTRQGLRQTLIVRGTGATALMLPHSRATVRHPGEDARLADITDEASVWRELLGALRRAVPVRATLPRPGGDDLDALLGAIEAEHAWRCRPLRRGGAAVMPHLPLAGPRSRIYVLPDTTTLTVPSDHPELDVPDDGWAQGARRRPGPDDHLVLTTSLDGGAVRQVLTARRGAAAVHVTIEDGAVTPPAGDALPLTDPVAALRPLLAALVGEDAVAGWVLTREAQGLPLDAAAWAEALATLD